MASSFGVEMVPPSSRFNIDERQPKYVFDFTFGYKIGRHAVVSAIASGSSSHLVGFGTTFNPVGNAKAHYLASGFNFYLK